MKETLHKAQSLDNGLKESHQKNKFYVYALICPIDNQIRYIGATINPSIRFKQHLKDTYNIRKKEWIDNLSASNELPEMIILDSFNEEAKCIESEQAFIDKYRDVIFNGLKKMPYRYNITGDSDQITAHIPFDRDLYDKIKANAKANGLTVSAYIRLIVLEKIKP